MSLDSQFTTKLKEMTEGRVAIAEIVWPAFQNRLAESFTDLILGGFFLNLRQSRWRNTQGLEVIHKLQGLHFLTGHRFVKVCAAQGICDIHERSFVVLDVKIVTLKSKKHPLQPCRCVTEILRKDLLQGLVVCFHVDNVAPKNILVKFLASKHNTEELFLNLSVSGLILG